MTTISISTIALNYFKGIKSLTLPLGDGVNEIYGDNGTGKTTIKDAFLWCLFGKNSDGKSDFGIMTLDKDGNKIPNVEHSVTLSLIINGTKRDLKRTYIEEFVSRRGKVTDEVKHTVKYSIDGMEMPKKDFDMFVTNLINESTFRAVTDPAYFQSLHWKEQRAMLERIAGDIDYSVLDGDKRFDAITKDSEFKSIEELLQHLNYNIRIVKDKIDKIPARIEEQNSTCPEEQDWECIQEQIASIAHRLEEHTSTLNALRNGNDSAKLKHIREQIEFQDKRIDNMRQSAVNMANEEQRQFDLERTRLQNTLLESERTLKGLQFKLSANMQIISRAEQSIKELDERKASINKEYSEKVTHAKFVRPETPCCPLCHRPFEGADLEAEIAKLQQNFNLQKANDKERIMREVEQLKADKATAEATLVTYAELVNSCKTDIATIEATNKATQTEIDNLLAQKRYTSQERLESNPSYKQAMDAKAELQKELDGEVVTDNSKTIESLVSTINDEHNQQSYLQKELGKKEVYDTHKKRIEELKAENDTLTAQLDSLLERRDIAVEYQSARDSLLEETVNKAFSLVSFRLFDVLNDGTRKPNCICWVKTDKGFVPMSDANNASRINAGRDIINAICDYYEVYAPVITDNSESSNTFLPIKSQDIRLYVSHDKSITIK